MNKHQVRIEPLGIVCEVPHNTPLKDIIASYGVDLPCGGKGICGNCRVELLAGQIEQTIYHRQCVQQKGFSIDSWRLACLSYVTDNITIRIPTSQTPILTDDRPLQIASEEGYGIAVDLGSTTVVVQLLNRETGTVVDTSSEVNQQGRYGADILSRVAYAIQNPQSLQQLTYLIRNQIKKQISHLASQEQLAKVRKVVLVGNSVMHHLFSGLDVTPLSAYPFQSPYNESCYFTPEQLDWNLSTTCQIQFLPNLSHFVGSDILAGIYALQIHKQEKWQALIDLGTNGEIVIGHKHKILCTSTAAGPALEGINISQGMRAVSGAICQVNEKTGQPIVIGNETARGICGSGLIEAIDYFRKRGYIDETGTLAGDYEQAQLIPLTSQVRLSDKDIREYQLAKAAIATGFRLLLKHAGISVAEIEHIYVAGGLGNYLNIKKAINTGLLYADRPEQIHKSGNTALLGCKQLLYEQAQAEVETVRQFTTHYSLETDPDFQDIYCENMFFY